MEVEIQGIPNSIKGQYQSRVKASKADLTRYKKLAKETQNQSARAELLGRAGGSPAADEPYGDDSRTRLLAGTELLADGSRRLEESQRVALETEDIGADILRNLRGQREQIEHARDTVGFLDAT